MPPPLPLVSLSSAALLIVLSVAAATSQAALHSLSLTPMSALYHPWALLTCHFTEVDLVKLLAGTVALLVGGPLVESGVPLLPSLALRGPGALAPRAAPLLWLSTLNCLAFACLVPTLLLSLAHVVAFAGFGIERLATARVGGVTPVVAALSVMLAQRFPTLAIAPRYAAGFHVRHLPLSVCVCCTLASLLMPMGELPLVWGAAFGAWLFLRCLHYHAPVALAANAAALFAMARDAGSGAVVPHAAAAVAAGAAVPRLPSLRGDGGADFALAAFFPSSLPVDRLGAMAAKLPCVAPLFENLASHPPGAGSEGERCLAPLEGAGREDAHAHRYVRRAEALLEHALAASALATSSAAAAEASGTSGSLPPV